MSADYFDETYFESGQDKGTQYKEYLSQAKKNRTYFEIANAIFNVFRPRRTLEIGCAIGAVVSHVAAFDVEAHGIDVSKWAVENRLHPNVIIGSAADLPYEDNYFDVVYSVHALEHLPLDIKDATLAEISRVCRGYQFHMLPILEAGPYVGDRFGHLLNLRTDPTHSLLFDRIWWINQFAKFGWIDTDLQIAILHDNPHFELSDCQFVLSKEASSREVNLAAARHNHSIARMLNMALNGKPPPGFEIYLERIRHGAA